MATILISTSSFGKVSSRPLDELRSAGFEVLLNPHGRSLTPSESVRLLDGVVGVIAGTERLDRDVLASSPTLKAISRLGAGLENVDLTAAADLGIAVASTPEPPARAVAELALGGLLNVLRHVATADRELREGTWRKPMGRLLHRKTVGIVGAGRAGKAFAALLGPFECRLLVVDPVPDGGWAERTGASFVALDELLPAADIVSLHLPLEPSTHGLIGRERMAQMKAGAILVNCARGGLVDEQALIENLKTGHLGGAFLDVFEREPYEGGLTHLPNTLLTPHIGSYAAECRLQMENEAVQNLIDLLREERAGS